MDDVENTTNLHEYVKNQNEINDIHKKHMEMQSKKNNDMDVKMDKILALLEQQPASKRPRTDIAHCSKHPDVTVLGTEEEAIEGSNEDNMVELTLRENEKTLETNLDDDHNDILSTLLSHDNQVEERGDDEISRDIDCLSDEQLEAALGSAVRGPGNGILQP